MKQINELLFPQDVKLTCESKIAYESNDHLYPKGTKHDNSKNWIFNHKIYKLYFPKYAGQVSDAFKVLDLGCAGGGFVRACMNDGCFAIGLEGSDYSKKMKRAEWPIIPDSLFTCDITKNFDLANKKNKKRIQFNLITAWEVLEHLEEEQIEGMIQNVKKHLEEDGLFIASVANWSDKVGDIEFHKTQQPKPWWVKKFKEQGLHIKEDLYPYFNGQYVRGGKQTKKSFHIIACKNPKKIPPTPKLTLNDKIVDKWKGSRIQRLLLK